MSDFKTDLPLSEIKKRIKNSVLSLSARQVALRMISFISINVILARILPVETLGIYNIAAAIITFFAFFSDIGLAASLIQKKEKIEREDINTTFTLQFLIVGILSVIIILGAEYLAGFYELDSSGVWLIRALGISFFLSSLKVVPSVMFERELKFSPLVLVEIVETLIFNILLITLAILGFGLVGFSVAALARGGIGVVLLYIISPIRPGVGISRSSANKLLSYGIPYQANSLLALAKDRLVPLVIAKMVGPVGVGYITWSQSIAALPLEVMSIVIRITFPAFSRLQHDKKALGKALEKSLFVTTLVVYPMLFGLVAILPEVVTYIVSPKWRGAITLFYLYAFSSYLAVISTIFTNTLNAIGMIKTTLKLMILWTILTWILTPILVQAYGYVGSGIASIIISLTSILTIILLKRVIEIKVIDSIFIPTIASLLMAILVKFYVNYFVSSQLSLYFAIFCGGIVYVAIIYLIGREKLKDLISFLRKSDD